MRPLVLLVGMWATAACDDGSIAGKAQQPADPPPPPEALPQVLGFIPDLVMELGQIVVMENSLHSSYSGTRHLLRCS